ncbi:MAG: formylglycine-generating enzyme family protein [Nitrospinae bacterium]|nr:formylglycine-generating enzyme family protein [Nitrospinota bacterium]
MAGGFMLSLKIQNVIEDTVVLSKNVPCQNCDDFAAMRSLQGIVSGQAAAPQAQAAAPAPAKAAPSAPEGMVFVKHGDGGFFMDKTEVTQEAYQRVIGSNPSKFQGCPTCPVEQVTWDEAAAYCTKVGKRLPTEQEWEYAATSGGKGEIYAGTSNEGELGDYAWYKDNSGGGGMSLFSSGKTHPVGKKKPNGLGLYDMSGNVSEWTDSWYNDKKEERVCRGGSWGNSAGPLRAAYRNYGGPDDSFSHFGFRCSQSP